jgi:beta-lactamase regulating signal transducer with metallopeptidase domain
MSLDELLAQPIGRVLTQALAHFLWQGLAVACALTAVVELCGIRRAAARYGCSLAALVLMAICPLVTLAWLSLDGRMLLASGASALEAMPRGTGPAVPRFSPLGAEPLARWLARAQPYALAAWLAGVILLGSRLLAGAVGSASLRRGRTPLPPDLARRVDWLGRRLQMQAAPVVFLSRHVAEAMAIGLARPLVLIPIAWAAQMPLDMLEAVVAHELAHLRRRDLWVNLLQRVVETVLFYHPAVWWLSRRLRVERELCADELAVAATQQRLAYARALEQVAVWRQAGVRPALAAYLRGETNMRLLERVQNVLGVTSGERSRLWPAGLLALVLPLSLWISLVALPHAAANDARDDDDDDKPRIQREAEREVEREVEGGRERAVRREGDADEGEQRDTPRRTVERERRSRPVESKTAEPAEGQRTGKEAWTPQRQRTNPRPDAAQPVKRGTDERHVLDELVVAVRQLAEQVEKLEAEVAELRGDRPPKGGDKDYKELIRRSYLDKASRATAAREEDERSTREAAERQGLLEEKVRLLKQREQDEAQKQEQIRGREPTKRILSEKLLREAREAQPANPEQKKAEDKAAEARASATKALLQGIQAREHAEQAKQDAAAVLRALERILKQQEAAAQDDKPQRP